MIANRNVRALQEAAEYVVSLNAVRIGKAVQKPPVKRTPEETALIRLNAALRPLGGRACPT